MNEENSSNNEIIIPFRFRAWWSFSIQGSNFGPRNIKECVFIVAQEAKRKLSSSFAKDVENTISINSRDPIIVDSIDRPFAIGCYIISIAIYERVFCKLKKMFRDHLILNG